MPLCLIVPGRLQTPATPGSKARRWTCLDNKPGTGRSPSPCHVEHGAARTDLTKARIGPGRGEADLQLYDIGAASATPPLLGGVAVAGVERDPGPVRGVPFEVVQAHVARDVAQREPAAAPVDDLPLLGCRVVAGD